MKAMEKTVNEAIDDVGTLLPNSNLFYCKYPTKPLLLVSKFQTDVFKT